VKDGFADRAGTEKAGTSAPLTHVSRRAKIESCGESAKSAADAPRHSPTPLRKKFTDARRRHGKEILLTQLEDFFLTLDKTLTPAHRSR